MRTPRFSGVGFLFILFSQAIEERHFMKREISLRQGIARNIPCLTTNDFHMRDLAKRKSPARSCSHETLELAERESSVDRALRPHGPRGDRVSHRRATGAD